MDLIKMCFAKMFQYLKEHNGYITPEDAIDFRDCVYMVFKNRDKETLRDFLKFVGDNYIIIGRSGQELPKDVFKKYITRGKKNV